MIDGVSTHTKANISADTQLTYHLREDLDGDKLIALDINSLLWNQWDGVLRPSMTTVGPICLHAECFDEAKRLVAQVERLHNERLKAQLLVKRRGRKGSSTTRNRPATTATGFYSTKLANSAYRRRRKRNS